MADTQDQTKQKNKTILVGTVRSISGKNTINVLVKDLVRHPMYGKYVQKHNKLAVHTVSDSVRVGDMVEIAPCRKISKTKSWRMIRVVRGGQSEQ